jgi:polyisoprenoid-binding protein YceI
MKSRFKSVIQFVSSKVGLMVLMFACAAAIMSVPAHAQDDVWKADKEHSIARLSLGSGANAMEIGLARVSGHVIYKADDPADPLVKLNISPEKSLGAEYSQISFNSKRSMLTPDGKVAVIGDLALTRAERRVTLDANEGYYGAVYGEPVIQTETREVTFLLPAQRPAVANETVQLPVSATITREYFPQLLRALAPGSWPTSVVEDQNCSLPSTLPGEDYAGAVCTGTTVSTRTSELASGTPATGEGYYGFEPATLPDGGQINIAMDLQLTHAGAAATGAVAGN